jgi:predicted kinase
MKVMEIPENIIKDLTAQAKKLSILCGYPYSGKSLIAKQILEKVDCVFVSIDDIFYSRGFDWDTSKLPNTDEWQEIFDESYKKTKAALSEGQNVLYDSTNQTLEGRDTLREVAKEAGADTQVIYIKTSPETVWKRWEENQEKPVRSIVQRELVQVTIDTFEEPRVNEKVIVIKN